MQAKIKEIKNKLSVFLSFNRQYFQWKKIHPSKIDIKNDNLLIVPCDPWAIGGSRGDEAMLIAIIQWYRKKYPKSHIFIISASKEGCDYINNLPYSKITALYEWCGTNPIDRIYKTAINIDINSVILLGADCMDGFYSPFVSLTLIALHELFSLTGNIKSRLMGFSFNNSPYRPICKAFDSLSSDVCINLRDPISLQRFKKQIRINAGLVADVAFLLTPDYDFDGYKRLQEWTTLRHQAQGQYVIGFNFHPMLRKYGDVNGIRKDALAMAEILAEILRRNKNIHFVIIPHDNRNKLTDNIMLGTGKVCITINLKNELFYEVLSEITGIEITNEGELFSIMRMLSETKKKYDKIAGALEEVKAKGYGIVTPSIDELVLEEPEMVKQGSRFGVRLRATAPSIHLIRANIETEVSPIVGSEKQSEELVNYLLSGFENDPTSIWNSNIFGKSLHELVNEGLQTKLAKMPEEAQMKLQETLERIVNEGSGGLICIIL